MTQAKDNGGQTVTAYDRLKFHYLKNKNFRTIHIDGVVGGVTPSNLIHVAIYSERPPIPKEMVYEVNPDGTLGEAVHDETVTLDGLVREMEVDILLDIVKAKGISEWLQEQITVAETRIEEMKRARA